MGQKINPNIFRLGINKTWKTEFFEKKRHELPVYTFKDLEIKGYIERFLEMQGIYLHDYKQQYSNSTLNIYISYFVSPEFNQQKKDNTIKMTIINKLGAKKIIEDVKPSIELNINSNYALSKGQTSEYLYKTKKYWKQQSSYLNSLGKVAVVSKEFEDRLMNFKIKGVLENLFKVLSLFTKNKFNIIINFCCLNKDLSFLKKTQKKNFLLLQKFRGTSFLKEGIELLFYVVHSKASADLLAKFIAIQIKKVKRHKFFLAFLKQTLTVLSNSMFSKIKGVKIIIKGRLNGVPRAKHKTIIIGDVPVQSIKEAISYSQKTVHNSNGSYGVKVWIIEKSKINLKCFYNQGKQSIKKREKED